MNRNKPGTTGPSFPPALHGRRLVASLALLMMIAACGGGAEAPTGVAGDSNDTTPAPVADNDQSEQPATDDPRAVDPDAATDPDPDSGISESTDDDTDSTNTTGSTDSATNLLNPAGQWLTWTGEQSGIIFDAATEELVIPPAGSDSPAVTGVQRFLQQLIAGHEYQLTLPSADGGVVATLFLYGRANEPIAFVNQTTGLSSMSHSATPAQAVTLIAPAGVSGFAVQLQGPWPTTVASRLQVLFSTPDGGTTATTVKFDYRPSGYENLVMTDEFDGTGLDRSRWCTRLAYGGGPPLQLPDDQCTRYPGMGVADYANIDENQRFRDINANGEPLHVVAGGVIRLRATLTGSDPYTRFEAAALRSKQAFRPDGNKRYYLTARVQLPDVLGIWPAFFIIPGLEPNGEAQWPPEVDIFEGAINGGQGENPFTLIQHAQVQGAQTASGESEWFFAAPGFDTSWGYWRSPVNLRNRWIEVGMEWTSDAVCYFVDGDKTGCERYAWVTNDGRLANPAEVVMLLAVGGPWAGRNGIDDGAFPTEFLVDHIRVYERED